MSGNMILKLATTYLPYETLPTWALLYYTLL